MKSDVVGTSDFFLNLLGRVAEEGAEFAVSGRHKEFLHHTSMIIRTIVITPAMTSKG